MNGIDRIDATPSECVVATLPECVVTQHRPVEGFSAHDSHE